MQPTLQEDRPPYVQYETRAEEDREASISSGMYRTKDVNYAIVTPMGSKDRFEQRADEWFEKLQQQVRESRFPQHWLQAYRAQYDAWKAGQELPVDGTAIRNWPVVSPSQAKLLTDLKVRTVEDLAVANEETIARIGMGGRGLKEMAKQFLAQASGPGKVAQELAALKAENEGLKNRNAQLDASVADLSAKVDALLRSTPVSPHVGHRHVPDDDAGIDGIADSIAGQIDRGLSGSATPL